MKILITICARGGSKGVPGKNIRELNGMPLIAYSISTAKQLIAQLTEHSFDLALSTDSEEIRNVARDHGLETDYKRPDQLATDKAGKIGVIYDVVQYLESKNKYLYDYVIDLDVTSPLRTIEDIKSALWNLEKNESALNIFSVSQPNRNPYFNMVELQDDGFAKVVKPLDSAFLSRQSAPKVYDMNASFYIYKKAFFDANLNSAITDKSLIFLMEHECFDIDNELDFEIMEYLLKEDKLQIKLS